MPFISNEREKHNTGISKVNIGRDICHVVYILFF
jgi:hypothetical protein